MYISPRASFYKALIFTFRAAGSAVHSFIMGRFISVILLFLQCKDGCIWSLVGCVTNELLVSFLVISQSSSNQPINSSCKSDTECQSGCCALTTGQCTDPSVALQRGGGCGFGAVISRASGGGGGQSSSAIKSAVCSATSKTVAAQSNVSQTAAAAAASGTQFITGACTSDADCASGCCGFSTGKCAGAIVALERDGGCGFGNSTPNSSAAVALRGGSPTSAAATSATVVNSATSSVCKRQVRYTA